MQLSRLWTLALLATVILQPRATRSSEPAIDMFGDFRVRNEGIWDETTDQRIRSRFRARVGVGSDVTEDVRVAVRLATGSASPTSANQTMTGAFSAKAIYIDRAYAEWNRSDGAPITAIAGKMPNPLFRAGGNQLIWDSDVSPEGFSVSYGAASKHATPLFANANVFWIDEQATGDDILLFAAQAGPNIRIGDAGSLVIGGGYLHYTNPFQNVEWRPIEAFAQFSTGNDEIGVTAFANAAVNLAEDDDTTAWLIGIQTRSGNWCFGYSYRHAEVFAVPQHFTDFNFAGGATNASGHEISVSATPVNGLALKLTEYFNTVGLVGPTSTYYSRLMFDVSLSF